MNDDILDATHLDLNSSAHSDLINLLGQVATGKPIILHQNGEEVAALISIKDLYLLERLIEEEENRMDLADVQKILAETKEEDWIPFEQIKAELGL
jgi:prevent-host-death family protein